MNQLLSKPFTVLNNRILWFDGDSSYSVKAIADKILLGEDWEKEFIIDPGDFSVKRYNELIGENRLTNKTSLNLDEEAFKWKIPEKYKEISAVNIICSLLKDELSSNKFSEEEKKERIIRVNEELNLWEKNELMDVLKLLIFIVSIFTMNNIIWGTGRGSSCCSYILYLIGVHDVDSVYYNLDITDFFRA
jgi:DNA polymerase III alpha subunit